MNPKPVIPRTAASDDIDQVIQHYLDERAFEAANGFVDALEQAYRHLGYHPASGSTRYAHELNLPELRFWPLKGYPYLIFHIEQGHSIDVWRLLHNHQDIPVWMSMEVMVP